MSAPVVASAGAEKTGTSAKATLGAPSGVSAGDLLVAAFENASSEVPFISSPAGWTRLQREGENGADSLDVWWKIATGSDSYVWEWEAGFAWAAIAFRITGHDASTPIPVSGKASVFPASTSSKTATITTPRNECLVVSIFGEDGDATGIGWSSAGATEFFDFQEATSFVEIAGYSETKEAKGEISRTATLAASNESSSVIFAVQPPEESPAGPRCGSLALLGVGR